MNEDVKNKPGPKSKPYAISDPKIRKIPGATNITTASQYQKLVSYLAIPAADRDPCIRLGATVPPSPQMSKNASVRLKIARIFTEHEVMYSMEYHPPRCFVLIINSGKITEVLLKDLKDIPDTATTHDAEKGTITIHTDSVDKNNREPSQSIWVVTHPNGKVEVIKRLQDPRAAHRWMTNEQRPWNSKVVPEIVSLTEV